MPIVGSQINKVTAERKELKAGMRVSTNVDILDIDKTDVFIAGEKKNVLRVTFRFIVNYGEDGSKINLEGSLMYSGESKELEEIIKKWKKDKKIDTEFSIPVLNKAMEVSLIHAILLANNMNLPPPMSFPRVGRKEENK